MRFYTQTHKFYCGIDLHARTIYLCIVNHDGEIIEHKNLPTEPEPFLQLIESSREEIIVGVECVFLWDQTQCSKNSNLDSHQHLPAHCHNSQAFPHRTSFLHNSTDPLLEVLTDFSYTPEQGNLRNQLLLFD